MDELTRRALLGDREAQKEFTDRYSLLWCPYCLWPAKITVENGVSVVCTHCKARTKTLFDKAPFILPGETATEQVVKSWNTRPPLVVFCKDCVHYDGGSCEAHSTYADEYSTGYDFRPDDYDFCSMGKRRNTDE